MTVTIRSEESHLPPLLTYLIESGALPEAMARKVMGDFLARGESIEELLIRNCQMTDTDIATSYSQLSGVGYLPPTEIPSSASAEVRGLLPDHFIQTRGILPILILDGTLVVAAIDPTDGVLWEEIRFQTGLPVQPMVSTRKAIQKAIKSFSSSTTSSALESTTQAEPTGDSPSYTNVDATLPENKETETHRTVNRLLKVAAEERASDIHIEPTSNGFQVRIRVDGRLQEYPTAYVVDLTPALSRIKILAQMDISEKRIPQDGAFSIFSKGNRIDIRVSTVPSIFGEKMVLRLLDKSRIPLDVDRLGFSATQKSDLMKAIESPHGLIFVTGPTGSGKSTTLYSCVEKIRSPSKSILTVEDPVEFKISGVTQVQVRVAAGLTFAAALRAFLRQDPDTIMVGEVRDRETAEICLRAATTGHLVLSTLHTTDSLAVVTRLVDMQVDRFLLAATLRLVEAQRLLRRLCPKCRTEYQPERATCDRLSLDPNRSLFKARGCSGCRGTGYSGRLGLYEVISIGPALRQLIERGVPLAELRKCARSNGAKLLWDSGVEQIAEGTTTLEELVASVSFEEEHT